MQFKFFYPDSLKSTFNRTHFLSSTLISFKWYFYGVDKALDLYSGCSRFESQPPILNIASLCGFIQSLNENSLNYLDKAMIDSFLVNCNA